MDDLSLKQLKREFMGTSPSQQYLYRRKSLSTLDCSRYSYSLTKSINPNRQHKPEQNTNHNSCIHKQRSGQLLMNGSKLIDYSKNHAKKHLKLSNNYTSTKELTPNKQIKQQQSSINDDNEKIKNLSLEVEKLKKQKQIDGIIISRQNEVILKLQALSNTKLKSHAQVVATNWKQQIPMINWQEGKKYLEALLQIEEERNELRKQVRCLMLQLSQQRMHKQVFLEKINAHKLQQTNLVKHLSNLRGQKDKIVDQMANILSEL